MYAKKGHAEGASIGGHGLTLQRQLSTDWSRLFWLELARLAM